MQGWTAAGHFTDVDAELTQPSIAKTGHFPNEQLHLVWEYWPSLSTSLSESTSSAIFFRRRDTIPPTRPPQPSRHDTDADPGLLMTCDIAIDLNPAWHPDSERLIFQSRHAVEIGVSETHMNTGSRVNWEIWTIRLDGGDHRLLIRAYDLQPGLSSATTRERSSHPSHGAGLVTPAWSPRGEQIAFTADVDGDFEIWVARNALAVFSGAELQAVQLTRNTHQDVYPAWAPDTSQIAFQIKRYGDWNVGIMEFDGSREKLLHQSFANETRPVWSPNEKSMLFKSDRGRDLQSPFVLNLQDGEITQISPISSAGQSLPLGQFIESADWSPYGKAVVFQSNDALYFMPIEFPELPIEARLERPVDGDQVYGKVNLIGIARGELFREYRLEYASTPRLTSGTESVGINCACDT